MSTYFRWGWTEWSYEQYQGKKLGIGPLSLLTHWDLTGARANPSFSIMATHLSLPSPLSNMSNWLQRTLIWYLQWSCLWATWESWRFCFSVCFQIHFIQSSYSSPYFYFGWFSFYTSYEDWKDLSGAAPSGYAQNHLVRTVFHSSSLQYVYLTQSLVNAIFSVFPSIF